MAKSIVILGENTMLGLYLKKYFSTQTKINVIGINEEIHDILTDNISILESILVPHLNTNVLVVNTYHTIQQKLAKSIADIFPYTINIICSKYGAKFLHIATDFSCSDVKSIHSEANVNNAIRNYTYGIIRTSIIGEEINNGTGLIEWAKKYICKEIDGWSNHYWNGITCLQLAKIINQMIDQNIYWNGIRHIYSNETISKYDLLNIINDEYKLCIKINKISMGKDVDNSLVTNYPDNAKFNTPSIVEQIRELREFAPILYDYIMPKVLYLYWDGDIMSHLQSLTVVTFREHNPTWKIVLYIPIRRYIELSDVNSKKYIGTDYFYKLLKMDIETRILDFEQIGFKNDISGVEKTKYIKYWLLGNYGGMWSDMDIIYIKPVDKIFGANSTVLGDVGKVDTAICYYVENGVPIYQTGLMMSKQNNPFYLDLVKEYGNRIGDVFPEPHSIKAGYPNLNIYLMPRESFLPFQQHEIDNIFLHSKSDQITQHTVGIYLFGDESIYYHKIFDTSEYPTSGSIYQFINKYLPDKNDVSERAFMRKKCFDEIYHENIWTNMGDNIGQSKSGTGSIIEQTETIIKEIPKILKIMNVKTFVDCPCGDFNWMKYVKLDNIQYIGVDIVESLIERNNNLYRDKYHTFLKKDIVSDILPKCDVIFCRDCLVHLPNEDVIDAIRNFIKSGSSYLLTTVFTKDRTITNTEISLAKHQWRPLNLMIEPFNFPEPWILINENCTELDGIYDDKSLGLWKLSDLEPFVTKSL